MYSQLFINQFIEMRARRISVPKIVAQLRINKSTGTEWDRRYKAQIAQLRAIHFEAVCEKAGLNYEQEVTYAAEQLNRIRTELKKRKVEHVSTEFLYNAEVTGFARIERLFRLAEPPEGADEPLPASVEPQSENPPFSHPFPTRNGGEGAQNQGQTANNPQASPAPSGNQAPAPTPQSPASETHNSPIVQGCSKALPSPSGCGDAVSRRAPGCTRIEGEGQTRSASSPSSVHPEGQTHTINPSAPTALTNPSLNPPTP